MIIKREIKGESQSPDISSRVEQKKHFTYLLPVIVTTIAIDTVDTVSNERYVGL